MNSIDSIQEVFVDSPLTGNPQIMELLGLLAKNKTAEQYVDFSKLILCVGTMEEQLNRTVTELQEVKQELHSLQDSLTQENKAFFSDLTSSVETVLSQAREQLHGIKNSIAHAAETTVKNIKRTGTIGLNNALELLGVHKALCTLQTHLNRTVNVLEAGIGRVEAVSHELRDVGGHMQNIGRVMAGKERQEVQTNQTGRVTMAVVAPFQRIRDTIGKMEKLAGQAIGHLDDLEQAANEKKPSVKDALKGFEGKRVAGPNKTLKREEAAR
jgi:ElaB/YqjD/DUF883 family membrane-anchored ribosome-binding protein